MAMQVEAPVKIPPKAAKQYGPLRRPARAGGASRAARGGPKKPGAVMPAAPKEPGKLEQHRVAWKNFHDSVNRIFAPRKQGAPIGEREFGALTKEARGHLDAIGGVVVSAHREGVAESEAKAMRRDVQQVFSHKRSEELRRRISRLHEDGKITGGQREVIEGLLTKGGVLAGEHMKALDPKRQKTLSVHARSFNDMGRTFEGALKRMGA